MPELNGSKLIAMFSDHESTLIIEFDFGIYLDQHLKRIGMDRAKVSELTGINPVRLGTRISSPEKFEARELIAFLKATQLEDKCKLLIEKVGMGTTGCTYPELKEILREYGYHFEIITNVA